MKYLLTLYDTASAPSEGVTFGKPRSEPVTTNAFRDWCEDNNVQILLGETTYPTESATTLRFIKGDWAVTDGAIHTGDARLDGVVVIECEHADLALAAARQLPNRGACELRPIIG